MQKPFKLIFINLFLFFFLVGCSANSFTNESKLTRNTVKSTFTNEKAIKSNHTIGKTSFYLPFGFDLKSLTPNNILLKNGSKTYILFINPKENSTSKIVYQSSIAHNKNLNVKDSFRKNNKFGYMIIQRMKDDTNELTIGVGGSKITTETKTGSMKEEAKEMMKIVNSVKIIK